jgi:hypothetical protein
MTDDGGNMEISTLFLHSHHALRNWLRQIRELPEDRWRVRPHGMNSIAWLIWHMARVEDSGMNRLVFDSPQVIDDPEMRWMDRMNVHIRHHGTTMTSAEVDDLTDRVDITALWAYSEAVAERSRDLVGHLRPEALDDAVEPTHLRRVLFDEGMLRSEHTWMDPLPYSDRPQGQLLMHFGLTHNYGHLYDIWTIRGFIQAT